VSPGLLFAKKAGPSTYTLHKTFNATERVALGRKLAWNSNSGMSDRYLTVIIPSVVPLINSRNLELLMC
jgi:hypothetical protein